MDRLAPRALRPPLDCRLYGILDLGYIAAADAPDIARRMIAGGVDILQLRAKGVLAPEILAVAAQVRPITEAAGVPFIINDHPFLVERAGADGAHIGQDDGPLAAARARAGAGKWVGRSTHSHAQALAARDEGADYLGFGPLFPTPTKPDYPAIGLEEIARVHTEIPDRPIFCIGGIKLENLPQVIAAGARRVVIVSGILQAADVAAYTRACIDLLKAAGLKAAGGRKQAAAGSRHDVLAVEGLRIVRGEQVILEDVCWRVQRGEHWVILGSNGSGKTSLLSALTAYLTPSAGTVEVLGERYGRSDWRELRKRVGLVSSSIRQMIRDEVTGLEVVVSGKDATLNPWGRVSAADRKRATAILRRVELVKLAARPWAVLSQGERQRVLIGRALMAAPPLLILDEPCAGLDPLAREGFVRFLQRLGGRRGAPALILVTHHVEEIAPVFTHALLLHEGRVLASGPIAKTLTTAHLTAAFGAPMRLRRDRHARYTLSVRSTGRGVI